MRHLFNRLTRSWNLIAHYPDPAIKLFKFGVVTCGNAFWGVVPWGESGGVEDTSLDKICCGLGINFELAKSIAFCPAFCPALRAMFKAMSTTCFLLMNPDKNSLSFEKIPEPPTWYFLWYPHLKTIIYLMPALSFCKDHETKFSASKVHHKCWLFRFEDQCFLLVLKPSTFQPFTQGVWATWEKALT